LQQDIGAWRLSDGAARWRFGTIRYGSPVDQFRLVATTGILESFSVRAP
jgi:hypothetical protein